MDITDPLNPASPAFWIIFDDDINSTKKKNTSTVKHEMHDIQIKNTEYYVLPIVFIVLVLLIIMFGVKK